MAVYYNDDVYPDAPAAAAGGSEHVLGGGGTPTAEQHDPEMPIASSVSAAAVAVGGRS
jgi:hypothetical protein